MPYFPLKLLGSDKYISRSLLGSDKYISRSLLVKSVQ